MCISSKTRKFLELLVMGTFPQKRDLRRLLLLRRFGFSHRRGDREKSGGTLETFHPGILCPTGRPDFTPPGALDLDRNLHVVDPEELQRQQSRRFPARPQVPGCVVLGIHPDIHLQLVPSLKSADPVWAAFPRPMVLVHRGAVLFSFPPGASKAGKQEKPRRFLVGSDGSGFSLAVGQPSLSIKLLHADLRLSRGL